jgi:opacity protein-like surface antigen
MKKLFLFAVAFLCFGAAAQAQSTTDNRVDVYGGYTFQHTRSDGDGINRNGFNLGANFWVNQSRKFGINGEYSFTTGDDTARTVVGSTTNVLNFRSRYNTFGAGPIYRFSTGRVQPYVRALFGATRVGTRTDLTSTTGSTTTTTRVNADATSFTFITGGGLDVNLTKDGKFAWRVGAVDYQFIKDNRLFDNQNGVRVSTGLVIRF